MSDSDHCKCYLFSLVTPVYSLHYFIAVFSSFYTAGLLIKRCIRHCLVPYRCLFLGHTWHRQCRLSVSLYRWHVNVSQLLLLFFILLHWRLPCGVLKR